MVGVPELGGELGRVVEPVEADEGLVGGWVAADFEDCGGPEGGVWEVVAGYGDGVVEVVGEVSDWVFCGGLVGGRGEGELARTLEFSEPL